jgi:signal transduction histidine kinase/CheY-like chemotaxis protein
MKRWVDAYERVLRISEDERPELVMRMRAVWIIGLLVVATQICNLVVMSFVYGRWTLDHAIALAAVCIIVAIVHLVRWYKNAIFYAAFYSALMFAATLGSALPDNTGINSALLPFIALGPVLAGFMAGRRAAVMFWGAGLVVIGYLYWVSMTHEPLVSPFDYTRESSRFFQSLFVLTISTGISVMITERVYALIAEQRENADRARRAEAAKSDFLATMSHELRTPLNGVIGLTDALLGGALPERERQLTETIRKSGESLLFILNDLLDLSKIEAGKLAVEPRAADLRDIVRFVADIWRETASAKGLAVHAHVTGDIPHTAHVDDLRLRQILQNLMANGVKFTQAGHVHLHLHGTAQGEGRYSLEFRIADTGRGVSDGQRARIFDPFEQGERGTTRQFGGTGLGLPICRKLAELMGGSIELEQTSPEGSTFLVMLPVEAAIPTREDLEDDVYDAAEDLRGLRVLVAEDNEINRLVVGEFLKAWGAQADFAHDGPTCLEMLAARPYAVVLMDKHMPGMSGMDTARAIRHIGGPLASVPIVAVTADAMPGEREAMLAAGMNEYITKPLRAEALKAVILRALKMRAAA